MYAHVGDRLVVKSQHVDGPDRDGEVLEVQHPDGSPPYLVRWSDNGHEALIFPGPDAFVEHFGESGDTT
jgi:hypothetical protein